VVSVTITALSWHVFALPSSTLRMEGACPLIAPSSTHSVCAVENMDDDADDHESETEVITCDAFLA
jgi:hypothetical protein